MTNQRHQQALRGGVPLGCNGSVPIRARGSEKLVSCGAGLSLSGTASTRIASRRKPERSRRAQHGPFPYEHRIAQGFLAFVRSRADGPLFYNPEGSRKDGADPTNPRRSRAVKCRERLATWVREASPILTSSQPTAERHTFKQIAESPFAGPIRPKDRRVRPGASLRLAYRTGPASDILGCVPWAWGIGCISVSGNGVSS
jgi:hypothetical protein